MEKLEKTKAHTFFLSFVEEFVMNPLYFGYVGGRCEVTWPNSTSGYHDEELRFFTRKQKAFWQFREKWDFKDVTKREYEFVKKELKTKFLTYPKIV